MGDEVRGEEEKVRLTRIRVLERGGGDLLGRCREWEKMVDDHPEVYMGILEMLGLRKKPDDKGLRIQ